VNDCNEATEGLYISTTGAVGDGIACAAGSVCERGESTSTGNLLVTTCPAGYYCPSGTLHPIACPPGTYNALTGKTTKSDCLNCPAKKYCPN